MLVSKFEMQCGMCGIDWKYATKNRIPCSAHGTSYRTHRWGRKRAGKTYTFTKQLMSNEGPLVEERNFEKELTSLINQHSLEKRSGTPDFILAKYLVNCLKAYEETKRSNDTWHK